MGFRFLFLVLVVAGAAVGLSAAPRPNLLVFIADDVSWNDLGCYGNPAARTPHIDRLAANGLRFDEAILTASSCSPSRASIMTGRYPHNTGDASELHRPWAARLPTFPAALREHGYYTAQAGKFHMDQERRDDGTKLLDHAFDRIEPVTKLPGNSGGHGRWLEVTRDRPRDQPFFFWFAAIDAHRGWDGDAEWQPELFGPKHDPDGVMVPPFLADNAATRADLASYYNEITRFDYFVGQVIAELTRQGVLENTLVVVMADNGRPFPRAKTRLHDSGMKTPFVVHWPAGIRDSGQSRHGLISAIDLAPTFLSLAGVPIPATFQGVDITAEIRDGHPVRKYAFSEHNWHDYEAHGRSVRTADGWLYIRNARPERAWLGPADAVSSPSHQALVERREETGLTLAQEDTFREPRPREELYYSPADPRQIKNLVTDPRAQDRLIHLRSVMDAWQEATHDSAPANFTPDYFDRVSGYSDHATGKPVSEVREPILGVSPGSDRGASQVDAPGPR
jgi:N-sulfoglucosamine sulfohydrolase